MRAKHPSKEKRISGKVINDTGGVSYFMLDPINLQNKMIEVPTRMKCPEIVNLLLQNGYVPVDSWFEVIPTTASFV